MSRQEELKQDAKALSYLWAFNITEKLTDAFGRDKALEVLGWLTEAFQELVTIAQREGPDEPR